MSGAHEASGSRRRGAPPAGDRLTREAVLRRAESLIDRDGVATFSLRALARELGVRSGALYNHISGRDDLLAAVTARFMAGFALPDNADHEWSQWLRSVAHDLRDRLHSHPQRGELVLSHAADTSAGLHYQARFLDHLEQVGLTRADAHLAWHVVYTVVIGTFAQHRRRGPDPADTFGAILDVAIDGMVAEVERGTSSRSNALLAAHRHATRVD